MLILITALGSAGDVHPFIAIGRALVAQGHKVRILASPNFEDRVVRAGVDFAPMGRPGEYEQLLQHPDLWHPRRGGRFILDELIDRLPQAYATTVSHVVPGRTLLVGSTLAWSTRLVQERLNIPAATIHLSPLCLPSVIRPPALPGIGDVSWMPTWSIRLLQWSAERFAIDRWTGPRLDRIRADLGLMPVRQVWSRWMHSPDCVIGAWPEWFAPTQPDWPAHATTSGFPLFDEHDAALEPSLQSFLASGTPPIGITPGSAMAHGRRFFDKSLAACKALGSRAVVVTPYREQLPVDLPAWVHHIAYAPFGALLPRLSGLVHHGGIGTAAQALRAGIPQVVTPFAHDQFDNAARLRGLGVSMTVSVGASDAAWVRALRRTLNDVAVKGAVRDVAARMRSGPPGAEIIALKLSRFGEGRVSFDDVRGADEGRPGDR